MQNEQQESAEEKGISRQNERTIADMLNGERMKAAIAAVLPRHLTPERMIKVAVASIRRNPTLAKCTTSSLCVAIVMAAELGLEPGGALGHGYLVPFKNQGVYEAQFIPGYRGLIALARRSGEILSIAAHPVYVRDHFELELGVEPKLTHRPWMPQYGDDGKIIGPSSPGVVRAVYAVAHLAGGGTQVETMTRVQVDAIRMRSAKGKKNEGPWKDDFDEMARKTVVRRICKYLPISVELASALEQLNAVDGDVETTIDVVGEIEDGSQTPPDANIGTAAVKERIRRKNAAAVPANAKPAEPALFGSRGESEPSRLVSLDGSPLPGSRPPREPGDDDAE